MRGKHSTTELQLQLSEGFFYKDLKKKKKRFKQAGKMIPEMIPDDRSSIPRTYGERRELIRK